MNENEQDLFCQKLREQFEKSTGSLDGETLSRITRARYSALDQKLVIKSSPFIWIPTGALVTACLAMFVYGLLPQPAVEDKTFIDDIEIISELDLYENLEFYEWLEQHEIPS